MGVSAAIRTFKGAFVFECCCQKITLVSLNFVFFVVVQMGEEYYHAKDYSKAIK